MRSEAATEDSARRPLRGRRRKRSYFVRLLFLGTLFLIGLAVAAPLIVSQTSLLNSFAASALPKEAGTVTLKNASLWWTSSPVLYGVELRDPQGELIVQANQVRVDQSLLQLMGGGQLQGLTLNEPVISLALRPDGSNLEDFLTALDEANQVDPDDPEASEPTPFKLLKVNVVDGRIYAFDTVTGETWVHDGWQVTADLQDEETIVNGAGEFGSAYAASPSVKIGNPPTPPGQLKFGLASSESGTVRLQADLQATPLAATEGWLRRIDPSLRLQGTASGQASAGWAVGPKVDLRTSGSLAIDDLELRCESLGGEVLRMQRIAAPWKARIQAGKLIIDELQVTSDLGKLRLSGVADPRRLPARNAGAEESPLSMVDRLVDEGKVNAEIDLALLAARLPRRLSLRQDTRIESGRLQLNASRTLPQGPAEGRRMNVDLRTLNLAATTAGKQIELGKPLVVRIDALESAAGWQLEQAVCESDFLTADFSGDASQVAGDATFDFDRLAVELKRLFDLRDWQFSGRGELKFSARKLPNFQFETTGDGTLQRVLVTHKGRPLLNEPQLQTILNCRGRVDPETLRPIEIGQGSLTVQAGADELALVLEEPLDLPAGDVLNQIAPLVDFRLAGDVARWQRRGVLVSQASGGDSATMPQFSGEIDARGKGRLSTERVAILNSEISIKRFALESPTLSIAEPELRISGDLLWDSIEGRLASRAGEAVTSSVAMRSRTVQIQLGSDDISASSSGEIALRGDLGRLIRWLPATKRPDITPRGQVTGLITLDGQPGRITTQTQLTGKGIQLVSREGVAVDAPPKVVWEEPVIQLAGGVVYTPRTDQVLLQQMTITSPTLGAQASGTIEQFTTRGQTNLTATLKYDLDQWNRALAAAAGPQVKLHGAGQASLEAIGPLFTPEGTTLASQWRGRLVAPWQSADAYGLKIGSGRLAATLTDGMVQFDPLAFAVGQGQLTAKPSVRLDPPPAEWGLAEGPLLTNIRISPEVSEQMLKYIAPVLAGATRTDGQFSLRIDGSRAPVSDISKIDAAGQLNVASVRVMPGPSVSEWVSVARQVEALAKNRDPAALLARPAPTLLSITDRNVAFRVVEGRVYHQGLEFDLGDVRVVSSGSVGFDETLNLNLSVPIQESWIAGDRYLVGLRGQSVQIPVGGTLAKPRVDKKAVRAFSQTLVRSAAQGAIQNEVGRALNKLFGN